MKKTISLFLSLMLAISMMMPLAVSAEWEEIGGEPDLMVGVIADSHVTNELRALDVFRESLSAQMTVAGGKLDGVALVGDVVYYPNSTDDPTETAAYEAVYSSLAEITHNAPVAYAIGNHEFPQSNNTTEVSDAGIETFKKMTGQELNYHTKFGDYHFIAGGGYGYGCTMSEDDMAWLKKEIDAAIAEDSTNATNGTFADGVVPNSTKPVFFLSHNPVEGSIFGASGNRFAPHFLEYLKTRPQVIHLAAHWHVPAQLPQTIWQDGYTVFQCPLTSGGYLEEHDATETGNISGYSQGAVIEVTDNVVKLHKLDMNQKTFIGSPWVIDIPAIVTDKTDDNPENDLDHYLYSDDKRTNGNVPVFPEGAEVTVEAAATVANIIYPNNAVMTASGDGRFCDDFTRGYKVDVETENGAVVVSNKYMTDFYKAEADRSATFTRLITNLAPGTTYTAKVYPWSPLGDFGEPIETKFTTTSVAVPDNAIRYEFEDYYPNKSVVKQSEMASEGSLVSSNQSGIVKDYTVEERNEEDPVIDFTFEIDVPMDDDYKTEYAIGYHRESAYVSKIDIYVDGNLIGKNDKNYDYDMSMGSQYPWQYIPMHHYTGQTVNLTKGKHTVQVDVHLPATTEKEQPFLFCMDYLQFTPQTAMLTPTSIARAEFETYADSVGTIPQEDGSGYIPKVHSAENCSDGRYLQIDTGNVADGVTAVVRIPFHVKTAGKYTADFVSIHCSPVAAYLDSIDGVNLAENVVMSGLDERNGDGIFPYFASKWFQAKSNRFTFEVNEGAHEMIFVVSKRSDGDIAQYLDYVEFYNALEYVAPDSVKTIEIDKYADKFSPISMTQKISFRSSGGSYCIVDTETDDNHEDLTVPIEMYVEKAGRYAIEYVASYVGSAVEFYANGIKINEDAQYKPLDSFDDALQVYPYFNERYHGARKYIATTNLEEGKQILEIRLKTRPEKGSLDVAGCLDYISFRCMDTIVTKEKTATIEFEDYWQNCTPNNGKYEVAMFDAASGGAYGRTGAGGEEIVTLSIPFTVEEDGVYSLEMVAAGASHLSTSYVYLDSADTDPVFIVSQSTGTDISNDKTLFSVDYPARKYNEKTVLTAGEHTLIVKAHPRNTDKLHDVAFAMDYLAFTPEKGDSFAIQNGVATAMVHFPEPVSGTAVIAAYSKNQLLAVNTKPVTNAKAVAIAAVADGADTVKVMVVDSTAGMIPQTVLKTGKLK